MNPINGTPTIAVHRPTSAMESFSKNRRRLISSGVSVSGADDDSVSFVSMANLRDPTGKRCEEEDNTYQPNDPDGDQSQSIDRVLVNWTNRNWRKGQDNAEHAAGSAGGKEINNPRWR